MSNKEVVKKRIERFYAEWFLGQAQLPSCALVDCEEPPDFVLDFGSEKAGLEITQLFKEEGMKGSKSKQTESERQKWLSEIADKYYTFSNVPLSVKIIIKSDKLDISTDCVASELVRKNSSDILELQQFEVCHVKIHMRRLPQDSEKYPEFINYRRWTMVNNHVGGVSRLKEEDVLQKINKKIRKLPKYKTKFNENILLIVIDSTVGSGMFRDIPHSICVPENDFSSIYVALYPKGIKEIWATPPQARSH